MNFPFDSEWSNWIELFNELCIYILLQLSIACLETNNNFLGTVVVLEIKEKFCVHILFITGLMVAVNQGGIVYASVLERYQKIKAFYKKRNHLSREKNLQ